LFRDPVRFHEEHEEHEERRRKRRRKEKVERENDGWALMNGDGEKRIGRHVWARTARMRKES
jgi:hypothetical protein